MSDARRILDMIEDVFPENMTRLDEIDSRTWCYLRKLTFGRLVKSRTWHKVNIPQVRFSVLKSTPAQRWLPKKHHYSRSRDALKRIRPEGSFIVWSEAVDGNMHSFGLASGIGGPTFKACARTEELAELHAIIQLVEYRRSQI